MPRTVYRITRAPYADLTGEGARLAGGRWNRPGLAAVYASESRALAVLELLVHVQPHRIPPDLVLLSVEIPDDVRHDARTEDRLPAGWQEVGAESCLDEGDTWLQSRSAAVLWVPSAVLPAERNAILNPQHPDHARIRISRRQPFQFDPRHLAVRTPTT